MWQLQFELFLTRLDYFVFLSESVEIEDDGFGFWEVDRSWIWSRIELILLLSCKKTSTQLDMVVLVCARTGWVRSGKLFCFETDLLVLCTVESRREVDFFCNKSIFIDNIYLILHFRFLQKIKKNLFLHICLSQRHRRWTQ